MADVEAYRNVFAEVLVLGSMLQGLEGAEQARFERRPSAGSGPTSAVDSTVAEKAEETRSNRLDFEQGWTFSNGLHGLSRMLYRQHAKQLKKAYSVA